MRQTGMPPAQVINPDVMMTQLAKIEERVAAVEGTRATANLLRENPNMTNLELLRLFEKVPEGVSVATFVGKKTRTIDSYRDAYAIWDQARKDLKLTTYTVKPPPKKKQVKWDDTESNSLL